MSAFDKTLWRGLKRKLQSIALGVTNVAVSIIDIPPEEGELGYTSSGNSIHLAYEHPVMNDMDVKHKTAFITGVFAHELMHRIATNFNALERACEKLKSAESQIFCTISNVIEDPAIEYQAPMYIGGHLLRCLSYSVMTIYKQTPPLEEAHPFTQFLNAMIMYGDGGQIKGEFTSPDAKSVFYKVLPIVDRAIAEKDGKKRIQLSYEVFLMTKPLWEDVAKEAEAMQELLKEVKSAMERNGKGTSGSSGGKQLHLDPDEDAAGSSTKQKQKRRKVTYRKVSREEMEELRKSAGAGGADPDGDIEILYCDEDEPKKENEKGKAGSEKGSSGAADPSEGTDSEDGGKSDTSRNDGAEGSGGPSEGGNSKDGAEGSTPNNEGAGGSSGAENEAGAMDGPESEGDAKNPKGGNALPGDSNAGGGIYSGDEPPDYDTPEEINEEEYNLSDEDMRRIDGLIEDINHEADIEKSERDSCYSDSLDISDLGCDYKGARCLNKRITCNDPIRLEAKYNSIVSKLSGSIVMLENQLKRLIRNQTAEREYRNTGRLNVKRLNSGRMTCRVFDRKIDPANMGDVCVEILVDESGSMSRDSNWSRAMRCVIALCEVFGRLRIPTKVIGFTADMGNYDAVHHHYMHWLNTKNERMNLMNINHYCNNFDGYSIRYATKMIAKRKEQHKFLIIISDGAPACRYYYKNNGVSDTADAIREAAKVADVIGVGIGNSSTSTLFAMYGNDFLHVKDADELLSNIGRAIQNKMRRWED